MKYIYSLGGSEDPQQHNAILLVGDHGMVLGHAQAIGLPPMEKLSSGEMFELPAVRVVLDATSLPGDVDDVLPDLASYLFTVVVRFGNRAELRLKNCSLVRSDMPLIHSDSRYVEFPDTEILVPRREV